MFTKILAPIAIIATITISVAGTTAFSSQALAFGSLTDALNNVTKQIATKPAKASSTDTTTNATTTSVKNPDGTRTTTKTDKNGNVVSKETVGNTPASASSTDTNTGATTTSVANPDGTRKVTTTN